MEQDRPPHAAAPEKNTARPMNLDWLTPDWPAPVHVHALCTTRAGGQSRAPYDSLNLGDHVGDDANDVALNRAILQQAVGVRPVYLSQVHGSRCERISGASAHGVPADGCIADQPGVACTIMVADCLPVLITDEEGRAVAAAHAGWRGLVGADGNGILATAIEQFRALAPVNKAQGATKIIAWLGPCIGPQAFEVGDEVREIFVRNDTATSALFTPKVRGKWLADLPGLARLRLNSLGVTAIFGNDGSAAWCTLANPSRFFSHRRDRVSGRMAACIWLDRPAAGSKL